METLEVHAPQKTKLLRANHKPYVTKEMRKAIMLRSQLQNEMFKHNTIENQRAFKHHEIIAIVYTKEREKITTVTYIWIKLRTTKNSGIQSNPYLVKKEELETT